MNAKKIRNILNILQEGVVEELKLTNSDLNFKLECRFLAEQINPSYSFFYGIFKQCRDIYFQPWDDEANIVNSVEDIKEMKPDLLGVEIMEDGYLKIYSNCLNTYSGGNLFINAGDIKVYDEDFRELNLEELTELSEKYWYSDYAAEG